MKKVNKKTNSLGGIILGIIIILVVSYIIIKWAL